ncbi:MAG: hypothetical protein AB1650_05665 [Candidatus Omnitrophota bacterium]
MTRTPSWVKAADFYSLPNKTLYHCCIAVLFLQAVAILCHNRYHILAVVIIFLRAYYADFLFLNSIIRGENINDRNHQE